MIGNFTVPIGEIMQEQKLMRKKEIEVIQETLKKLDNKLQGADMSVNYLHKIQEYFEQHDLTDELLQYDRDKALKAFKGTDNEYAYAEQLGANENTGDMAYDKTNKYINNQLTMLRRVSTHGRKPNALFDIDVANEMAKRKPSLKTSKQLEKENQAHRDRDKQIREDERIRKIEELNNKKTSQDYSMKIVVMPHYYKDTALSVLKEKDEMPEELFLPLGYDEDEDIVEFKKGETDIVPTGTVKRKHYRHFYQQELEDVDEIFQRKRPFNTIELKRGQTRGLERGGFFNLFRNQKLDASGQLSTEKIVGFFKGVIDVESIEAKSKYRQLKDYLLSEIIKRITKIHMIKKKYPMDLDLNQLRNKYGDLDTRSSKPP